MPKRHKDPAQLTLWGVRIALARRALGLEQKEVADATGLGASGNKTLSNWERGHAPPDPWFLAIFDELYGVDPAYILRGRMDGLSERLRAKIQKISGDCSG